MFSIISLNIDQKKEIDIGKLAKMFFFRILTSSLAAIIAGFIYFGFFLFGLLLNLNN